MVSLLLALVLLSPSVPLPEPGAAALLDSAMAHMGGAEALRGVHRLRIEVITEWQRTTLDRRPMTQVVGYEWSTELRDYDMPAWRYSRKFFGATGLNEVIDLVTDSVAAVAFKGTWRPQNTAYVEERNEVFALTPERVIVVVRDAPDVRLLPDTTIGGTRYARVAATVGGSRPTLLIGRGDGMLAAAMLKKGQPADFGLAAWGEMDLAVWYSRWAPVPNTQIFLPRQLDIIRAGRPYKRMTTITEAVNPTIPADSLSMPDSLRAGFLKAGRLAMYDLPLDSAKIVADKFAVLGPFGTPTGAIKLGGRWIFVEGGVAPLPVTRAAAFLARADSGSTIGGMILTSPFATAGLLWSLDHAVPVWTTPAARPYAEAVFKGWDRKAAKVTSLVEGWSRIGADSLYVESIDLPDFPGTSLLYVPSLHWAYAWPGSQPIAIPYLAARIRQRGWSVQRLGNGQDFAGKPLP